MANGQYKSGVIIAGVGVVALSIIAGALTIRSVRISTPATTAAAGESTIGELAAKVRQGDANSADALLANLDPKMERDPSITEEEAANLVEVIASTRASFIKATPKTRMVAIAITASVLDRFSKGNAPGTWVEVLSPVHDLLNSGLGDGEPSVRMAALGVISRAWTWAPNRALLPVEEQVLADWKQGFHTGVVRCLADNNDASRAAAVACLGALPMDQAASPATAYVDDSSPMVRRQVLNSFAQRTGILTEDAILQRTNDSEPDIAKLAEVILRGRGLSSEQVGLGRMIVHTKPDVRASVITLLRDREDIDPVTWLLQLSRDKDDSVRTKAVEALALQKESAEAIKRLREMAGTDASAIVRATAAKLAPAPGETTASLPPLPGSPSLNPKAN